MQTLLQTGLPGGGGYGTTSTPCSTAGAGLCADPSLFHVCTCLQATVLHRWTAFSPQARDMSGSSASSVACVLACRLLQLPCFHASSFQKLNSASQMHSLAPLAQVAAASRQHYTACTASNCHNWHTSCTWLLFSCTTRLYRWQPNAQPAAAAASAPAPAPAAPSLPQTDPVTELLETRLPPGLDAPGQTADLLLLLKLLNALDRCACPARNLHTQQTCSHSKGMHMWSAICASWTAAPPVARPQMGLR